MVVIVESSPAGPHSKAGGPSVRDIVVAGRRVRFRPRGGGTNVSAAQWATRRAFYSIIANGSGSGTLKRFIACLP
jgi:hypothetical protein